MIWSMEGGYSYSPSRMQSQICCEGWVSGWAPATATLLPTAQHSRPPLAALCKFSSPTGPLNLPARNWTWVKMIIHIGVKELDGGVAEVRRQNKIEIAEKCAFQNQSRSRLNRKPSSP